MVLEADQEEENVPPTRMQGTQLLLGTALELGLLLQAWSTWTYLLLWWNWLLLFHAALRWKEVWLMVLQ